MSTTTTTTTQAKTTPASVVATAAVTKSVSVPSAFDKAVFPFREPELRISDWGFDPISPDNSTILLESTDFKGKSLKDVYKDMAVPIIVFTSKCWQEIQYLTHKYSHQEWAVFLTMKKLDSHRPHFLAFDWFMPGQKASSGAVSMQAADSIKYYDRLIEKYPYYKENGVHKFLCHLHSHHSMAMPNFSSIDDNQQKSRDDLGFYDNYRFYIVVTCNNGVKASMVSYDPAFVRTNAAVALTWSEPEYVEELSKKRKQEIDEIAEKALFKDVTVYTTPATTYPRTKWEYKNSQWTAYPSSIEDEWDSWRSYGDYGGGVHKPVTQVQTGAKPSTTAANAYRKKTAKELLETYTSEEAILEYIDELSEMFKHYHFEQSKCAYEGELNELFTAVVKELNLGVTLDEERGVTLKGFCRLLLEGGASAENWDMVTDTLCMLAQLQAHRKEFKSSDEKAALKFLTEAVPHNWEELYELITVEQDKIPEDQYYSELFDALAWFWAKNARGEYIDEPVDTAKDDVPTDDDEEYEAYEGYRVD